MSKRSVISLLPIFAGVMALSACSSDVSPNVIAGPSSPVDPPPTVAPVVHSKAFIWSANSGVRVIQPPADVESIYISGINNHGQVIGDLIPRDGKEDFHAFVWSLNDGIRRLGSLIGAEGISRALTIDDDGEVRGLSEGPATTYFIALHLADGFVWTAGGGMKPTNSNPLVSYKPVSEGGKLILPAGATCMKLVTTVSSGLALGYAGLIDRGACRTWIALMWEADGTPVVIATCDPRCAGVSDINNLGEVVGYRDGGFRWTRSGGFVPVPIDEGWPSMINDKGDAVGVVSGGGPSPFVWTASGEIKRIDLPQGAASYYLAGINNSGQVVGTFR